MSFSRAAMELATAFSALASVPKRVERRAACTGGVGTGLALICWSYRESAFSTADLERVEALVRAVWRGMRGWSSEGAEELLLPKREPPSAAFLPGPRERSTSTYY
jgi:hypothetical protein